MINKKPFEIGDPIAHKAIKNTLGFILRTFELEQAVFFEVFWSAHPDNDVFGEAQQTVIQEKWIKHYRVRKNKKEVVDKK